MAGTLGRLALELGISNKELIGGLAEGDAAVGTFEKNATGGMSNVASAAGKLGAGAAVGLLVLGAASIHMAGDFQSSTTKLVTGAGESQGAIGIVRQGLLDMSVQVGTSAMKLSEGMFLVESAGFHGAAGLEVMRVAAEGAKVGGADMAVVADALTSSLNAYHLPASAAVSVTNTLIATVATGKMHMQDLAGSIGQVLPVAVQAHVSLAELGGAIATMTMQGTDANRATTSLRFLLSSLQKETPAGAKSLAALGGSADSLYAHLSTQGLGGALEYVTGLLSKKFPQATSIVNSEMAKVKDKTESVDVAMANIAKGGGAEYAKSMSDIVGGVRGLTGALELGGPNAATFAKNTKDISAAAKAGGKDVQGWATIQGDFNQKLDVLKAAAERAGIMLGNKLLPAATALATQALPPLVAVSGFLADHISTIGPIVLGVVGAMVALKVISLAQAVATGLVTAATTAWTVATGIAKVAQIAWAVISGVATGQVTLLAAAQWLLNVALNANPIGVIVLAIALLVGGVILAYQHVGWFRDFVNLLWKEIQILWGWISQNLMPILGAVAGVIGNVVVGAVQGLVAAFQAVASVVKAVWDAFSGFVGFLGGAVKNALGAITGPLGAVGNALNAINPFAKHSPSLVENVTAGVGIIAAQYKSLSGMKLSGPSIGGMSAGAFGGQGQNGPQVGAGGGIHIDHLEVNNPRSELDLGRALQSAQYLATLKARGLQPPPTMQGA